MSLLSGLGFGNTPAYTPPPPSPQPPSDPVAEPEAGSGSGGAGGLSGGGDTQTGQDGTSEAGATAGGAATVQPGLRGPALRNAEAARERAADRVQERTVGTGGGFVRPAADASVSRQQALALQGSLQAQRVLELMAAPGEEKPSLRLPPARSQPPAAQKPATVSMDV